MNHHTPNDSSAAWGAIGSSVDVDASPVVLVWNDPQTGETLRIELSGPAAFFDRLLTSNLWTSVSSDSGQPTNGVPISVRENRPGGSLVRSGTGRLLGDLRTGSTLPLVRDDDAGDSAA
jgi:hypothetical protein